MVKSDWSGRLAAGVSDGDGVAAGRDGGQDTAVLLEVDDIRAGGADRAAGGARGRAGERNGAPVGERDEPAVLLEVLDDPLRVLLAERGLAAEAVRDLLAGGVVDERRGAARRGSCGDGRGDRVAGADFEAREVVSVVGVPLVPG